MKHGLTEGCLGCRCLAEEVYHVMKGEPDAGAEAPAAVPAPLRPDGVQDEPMDAREAPRKRRAEDAGHEADDVGPGGAQPDPGSTA